MATYIDICSDYGLVTTGVVVEDMRAVQNKLFNLLRCHLGSRFRQPEFGTRLHEFVHQPCDQYTANEILRDFLRAIERWMPEMSLIMTQTYVLPLDNRAGFHVRVAFYVPRLQQQGSLAFKALP